jgi:hypothetical protein
MKEVLMNLTTLDAAMTHVGATDPKAFEAKVKELGCRYEFAGIVKVDIDRLEAALNGEFEKIAEAASVPKTKAHREGSDLGLIIARLALYPKRFEGKQAKIKTVEDKLAAATTPYEQHKLTRELKKLNDELQRLHDGKARDIALRDAILNGETSGVSK